MTTIFLLFCCGMAYGQSINSGSHVVDSRLQLKSCEFRGNYVVISYEIPFSGMTEIRLFNEEGIKIWQGQYADKHGENTIVLKRSKFHPGESYAYVLNYKKDEVRDLLVVPPMGFD